MVHTGFHPETHGFAFGNAWHYDETEMAFVRKLYKRAAFGPRTVVRLAPSNALVRLPIQRSIGDWVEQALVKPYGMCGGMAYAALDYYLAGLPLPRGKDRNLMPNRDTPEGEALRAYIWRRLVTSLIANGPTFLIWMAFLHYVPRKGWLLRGGEGWLLRQSQRHWKQLQAHIRADRPCVLGLIGTTTDPTINHQVLATGYDDPGDGTGTLYLYDMNCPGEEQTIEVDFRGEALQTVESCPSRERGPIRGFFCEIYVRNPRPSVIRWP